jgi:hypothetical protein
MEVEYSNTSSGRKYLDHWKFVFSKIGLDHLINNEININTLKRFFGFFVSKRKFNWLIKSEVLNFSKILVYFKVNNRTCGRISVVKVKITSKNLLWTLHSIEWSYVTARYAKPVLIMPPNPFNTSYLNVRHTKI